ncbi:MAG TPA: 3-phosphoshikimate 1-carboxyvinyltransferase [Actinomycetes bacterium]|nr:3-phosphoshikimate 1-carboxyvinyltransferase [Actinomycetes bacterium]
MTAQPLATVRIARRGPLRGRLRVPGDKSVSHRALILAGLASGSSTITGLSAGLDVLHTRQIMQAMGVRIDEADDRRSGHPIGTLAVTGGDLQEPQQILDVGNSGTGARLLAGVCAGQPFKSVITGDQSIASRPMDRVVEPLRAMGAQIDGREGGRFTPLTITGGNLRGIDYTPPVASAQVKSALLLAGLSADGSTIVRESVTTRRHTEEMLVEHGVDVTTVADGHGGSIVTLSPGPVSAGSFAVPGDPSQAAFWICAAAAVPGSDVTVENLYLSPERTGFLRVLQRMGADLAVDADAGVIRVVGAELAGVVVEAGELPDLIDEVPALSIAGALATSGTLEFQGAGELRAKESDRIETVAAMLHALGGRVSTGPESLAVSAGSLRPGTVKSRHDHRIAMAAAAATSGLAVDGEIEISGWDAVATSYPSFLDDLDALTTKH